MSHGHRRGAPLLVGALLLIALLFLPAPGDYFVADDHTVILRNTGASFGSMISWFTAARFGWYRPLFDVYIAACGWLYSLNPTSYYAMSLMLFALASALVAILGRLLSGHWRVTICAALLFILQSCHSEAVMWISSANELLAGVLVLSSLAAYIQFRRTGRPRWFLLAGLTCILAFLSKETALFLPVMFVVTDLLFYRSFAGKPPGPRAFLPIIPFVLLAAVVVVLRVSAVNYSVSYHPLQLAKNFVYYVLLETVAFPVVAADLAAPRVYLPVIAAALALSVAAALWISSRAGRAVTESRAPFIYAISLAVFALVPVVPIVAERTTFLSSAGVALALALLAVALWDRVARHENRLAKLAVLAFALCYLGANAFVLLERNHDWRVARSESRSVMTQLASYAKDLPEGTEVWLIGLPDQVGRAYAFRNAFPDAAVLAGYRPAVHAVLDVDLEKMSEAEKAELDARVGMPDVRLLLYWEGILTLSSG